MIIRNFYFVGPVLEPHETNPELIVDANAVLSFAVTLQRLEPVTGRDPQVIQGRSAIQHQKLS